MTLDTQAAIERFIQRGGMIQRIELHQRATGERQFRDALRNDVRTADGTPINHYQMRSA